jgi:hypothetical protein
MQKRMAAFEGEKYQKIEKKLEKEEDKEEVLKIKSQRKRTEIRQKCRYLIQSNFKQSYKTE